MHKSIFYGTSFSTKSAYLCRWQVQNHLTVCPTQCSHPFCPNYGCTFYQMCTTSLAYEDYTDSTNTQIQHLTKCWAILAEKQHICFIQHAFCDQENNTTTITALLIHSSHQQHCSFSMHFKSFRISFTLQKKLVNVM